MAKKSILSGFVLCLVMYSLASTAASCPKSFWNLPQKPEIKKHANSFWTLARTTGDSGIITTVYSVQKHQTPPSVSDETRADGFLKTEYDPEGGIFVINSINLYQGAEFRGERVLPRKIVHKKKSMKLSVFLLKKQLEYHGVSKKRLKEIIWKDIIHLPTIAHMNAVLKLGPSEEVILAAMSSSPFYDLSSEVFAAAGLKLRPRALVRGSRLSTTKALIHNHHINNELLEQQLLDSSKKGQVEAYFHMVFQLH